MCASVRRSACYMRTVHCTYICTYIQSTPLPHPLLFPLPMQVFGEVGRWWSVQPLSSRTLLLLSLSLPLALQLSLIPASLLLYHPPLLVRGQLWRVVTALFLAKPSLPFLFNVFFRYQYASQLEGAQFARKGGDFAYMLVMTGVLLNVQYQLTFCRCSIIRLP
jgi:membrane associated rhomboid family serine protease